jgi:hypothetical protein
MKIESQAARPARVKTPALRAELASRGPTVIYIAGSGRSGSTLLERVLGGLPDAVNVGELIDLFHRTVPQSERCGCGQPFACCPFWTRVGERAFGGWPDALITEVSHLQHRVSRQRHMPRLLAMPVAGRGFRSEVARYGARYASLYRAIAAQAGAAYVVDASKWPVQALALSRAGIDVRVIHLVRDVRGVAYSHDKRDVVRPHAMEDPDVMWRNSPMVTAGRWAACQSEAGLLARCGVPIARVRYEDFVRQPRRAAETALTRLGIPLGPSDLAHAGEGRVTLSQSHGLSGNPSRFRTGEFTLRADEAWRERMSRRDRALVTAIGLPLMLRYGWRPWTARSSQEGQP